MIPEESQRLTNRPYWTLNCEPSRMFKYDVEYTAVRWRSPEPKRLYLGNYAEEAQWVVDQLNQMEHELYLAGRKGKKWREGLQSLETVSDWHDDDLDVVRKTARMYREEGDNL